jgi:hypothetical protein
MHQVTLRATALQHTRQYQAQAAADRARLLGPRPRHRRSLLALLPQATRRAVPGRSGTARRAQARSSSAAAAKI